MPSHPPSVRSPQRERLDRGQQPLVLSLSVFKSKAERMRPQNGRERGQTFSFLAALVLKWVECNLASNELTPTHLSSWSCCRGSAVAKIIGRNVQNFEHFDKEVKMWVFEEKVDGQNLTDIINTKHENVK